MTCRKVISVILSLVIAFSIIAIPASADEIDTITVHYYNENNWSNPYIYYYYGGNTGDSWPGNAMSFEGDGWYSYTIYNYSTAYVIFSDNGSNQNPAQNEQGFQVSDEMWYYKGSWSTERPENVYTIVHYYNENNWSTPYIYYYTDNNNPVSWPGNAMVSEGGNWYTFTIPDLANPKVIFSNNGSNQNPAQNQPGFDVSGEKWYLNGTFYDSEPEGITVHYHNYDNWNNVNIYYYDGERTGNNWTGNPMISDGDGWYTYKIYGFDSVKVLFNNGGNIQIPGQYEPGFDVSGEMWYRNGEWTTERPNEITVFFYKPENWGTPNIYYYKNNNDTGPSWPGEQMTSEGDNWYSFTITKYDEANVLFNSNSSQIPAQNQPGFVASGVMWYKDGVWCNSESDSDNDDLPDFMEMILGTNLNSADSDGDGLLDGLEVLILGTDPLKTDSDENGVNDGAEDADSDGLTNLQEYTLGTDPTSADSDGDGLIDGDEVTIYHTDPLLIDTDGDGLSDYNEIQKGFNPLVFNADFDIILSCEGSDVTASVNIEGLTGEQAESLSIEPVDNYVLLDDRIPGYIDCAFDFSVSGSFDTAIISFEFDESLLNDEDFVPRIYYFNEQTQVLEELQDQTLQGNAISAETSHFSKYILLNKTAFDSVWDSEIKPPNYSSDYSGIDIVFVIDSSGSMTTNDSGNIRLSAAKAFVDKLGSNDRAAVIDFDTSATLLSSFTSSHSTLYSAINQVDSSGGTSLTAGISMAISQFTDLSYTRTDAYKYIIFLTDGDGDYSSSYTTLANNNNITIYSIGLGSGVKSSLLSSIATGTGGRYYFASTATTLPEIYDDIAVDTIDYTKDSNGDGISDYYTKLICEGRCVSGTGTNPFQGVSFEELQANDDYDGDGLKNGEEVEVVYYSDQDKVYLIVHSSPVSSDGDCDGIYDQNDDEPIKYEYNGIISRGEFGAIEYHGEIYNIVVPDHLGTYISNPSTWYVERELDFDELDFDEIKFLGGKNKLGGSGKNDRIYAGEYIIYNEQVKLQVGIPGALCGLLSAFHDSIDMYLLKFIFEKNKDGDKRVVIKVGSTSEREFFWTYAGKYYSAYETLSMTENGRLAVFYNSQQIAKTLEYLTGKTYPSGVFDIYDLREYIDEFHKDNWYSSYVWFNSECQLIERPIVYRGDKVTLEKRENFLFTPIVELPLGGDCPINERYNSLFERFFN